MRKSILFIILVFTTLSIYPQEVLLEKEINLKSLFKDKRESYPVENRINNELAIFLLDNKVINNLLLDKQFEIKENFTTTRPEKKFKILLGSSVDSSGYNLFFTNEKNNKFYTKTIDFQTKTSSGKLQELKLKDEKFLESINYKNKFYVLSVKKATSILKIYVFEGNKLSKTREYNLSKYTFSGSDFTELFDALCVDYNPFNLKLKIHKIDNSSPNPLDLTSEENKLYCYDDKLFITIDNELGNTKIIKIDLNDFSHQVKFYKQEYIDCSDAYNVKSNSYLYKDVLFQIKGCKQELYFSAHDITSDSLLNEFRVNKDEKIYFKNTPLIQEGGTTIFTEGTERELKKTKQALRKIAASNIGISVYELNQKLEITIGGYKEVQRSSGGGMMMTSPGMTVSTPYGAVTTAPVYHYNPTMYGYSTYTNTRSVYFKSLLEKSTYKHIEGSMSSNAFDKIKSFSNSEYDITSETIFKINDFYIFGYYKKYDQKYFLRKFND